MSKHIGRGNKNQVGEYNLSENGFGMSMMGAPSFRGRFDGFGGGFDSVPFGGLVGGDSFGMGQCTYGFNGMTLEKNAKILKVMKLIDKDQGIKAKCQLRYNGSVTVLAGSIVSSKMTEYSLINRNKELNIEMGLIEVIDENIAVLKEDIQYGSMVDAVKMIFGQ